MGITFSTCSLFYALLLFIVFFSKKRLNTLENNLYKKLVIISLAEVIFAIGCYYTIKYMEFVPILNEIVSRSLLACYIAWITVFTEYTFVISYKNKKNYLEKLVKCFNIFGVLLIIIVIFLPLGYHNENGMIYSYGKAAKFCFMWGGIFILLCLIASLSNYREVKRKKYIPIFSFMVLMVLVGIIQNINPSLLLMTSSEVFVTFLMYFTIENPDLKMIKELNMAKDQAERANKAKTEFLSSMSHEIRTPLNAIVGFSNSLNDNKNIPEDAKSDVKDILVASDSLLEIVNGVLDISKIEANKIEIIKKEYDTKKMFDELAKLTKVRIGDKPIEFVTSFDETLPRVLYGDQTRTKQVILNILTNAAKYTDKGKITFSVQSVIKDNVCRMIISVEDTGRGIKKESIDKLFDKFERLDEDRNTTIEGTGLGLAITKKLLEMMHGKIVVQSVYGKGSKFTISLDQRIVKNPSIKLDEVKTDDIEIINLSSKKVLVVDDNKLNIKVASRLLSPYKVEIVSAESGFEAIEILKEDKKINLVLMDDMMPKMSGKETLKEIKKNDLYDGPIIALTANALTGMREKYIEHGFTDYLSKPIEKTELNRILKTYLTK